MFLDAANDHTQLNMGDCSEGKGVFYTATAKAGASSSAEMTRRGKLGVESTKNQPKESLHQRNKSFVDIGYRNTMAAAGDCFCRIHAFDSEYWYSSFIKYHSSGVENFIPRSDLMHHQGVWNPAADHTVKQEGMNMNCLYNQNV
jgi:hypothetical protein